MAHVLVPMAPGCEDLETVTLIDILRRADVKVTTAGLDDKPVTGSRGTTFIPDTTLDNVMDVEFDLIALPGGLPGSDHLNNDTRIHQILRKTYERGHQVAAICAAPKVLANVGLLENRKATSFPGVLESMSLEHTKLTGKAIEIDERVVTSQSAGTAMDFALTLVGLLCGTDKQLEIEKQLVRTPV